MGGNHHQLPWYGVPREELLWWPIVQKCQCNGCGLCVISCPAEALAFDYELRIPFIRALHRCLVGCSTCATLCPNGAIQLPDPATLRQTIAQHGIARQSRSALLARKKRFGGVLPEVIYPDDLDKSHN
jgi:ferredoxin